MALTESNTDEFSLQQRYEAAPKQILATGIQALVRLPIDLMRADRAKGWNTAAFISGYQGSPLGGYDRELQSQRKLLDELNIVHVPGLNEELAATSVFGSQVAQTYARPKYEGVAGVWYGKSPGLDRAGDAIRHGSFGGTGRKGGVVLLVGDDAAAKSSTLPSRSDPTLVALHLPVFYPGTVQEVLDLGLHAFAMSRLTGLWVAMKITTPVADGSGIAEVSPESDRPCSARLRSRRQAVGTDAQRARRRPVCQHLGDRGPRQPDRMGQEVCRRKPAQPVRCQSCRCMAGDRGRRPRHAAGARSVARSRARRPSGSAISASAC